jgi:hypothetical protein
MAVRTDALAVKSHLSAAQKLINVVLGHTFQAFGQKIINTLTFTVIAYDFRNRRA